MKAKNSSPKKHRAISFFNSIRAGACLDLTTYVENAHALPTMMFEKRSYLEAWVASEPGLKAESVKGTTFDKMRRIHGKFKRGGVTLFYDQLWVKATHRGYRKPFVKHHAIRDGIDHRDLSSLHADHVINRARLRKLPGAWVVLFPVYGANNSRFGSLVEKKLPPLAMGIFHAAMDPLPAFKLLCDSIPKSPAHLSSQMDVIGGWLAVDSTNVMILSRFLSEMATQVRAAL